MDSKCKTTTTVNASRRRRGRSKKGQAIYQLFFSNSSIGNGIFVLHFQIWPPPLPTILLKRTYQDVWIFFSNKYCFSRFKSDKIQTVDYLYYMYLALNIEVCNYHRTDPSYITIHIQYYRYYSYYSKRRVQHFLTCKATLFSGFFKHFESQCNTYCLEIKKQLHFLTFFIVCFPFVNVIYERSFWTFSPLHEH